MTHFRALALAFAALLVIAAGPLQHRPAAHRPAAHPAAPHAAPAPAAPADWTKVIVRTPEGGWRIGNPNAKYKLVEFGSRSCPICGRFYADSGALRSQYVPSGKVSWEFRDMPVHPQDVGNSLLGRCVPTNAYFRVLDEMYANQGAFNNKVIALYPSDITRIQKMPRLQAARAWADILGYTDMMKREGMTPAQINQCFSPAALQALGNAVLAADKQYHIQGTPTFLLNGKRLDNIVAWRQLEPLLQ